MTDLLEAMETVHVPLPVHEPDQPVKAEPAEADAVSATLVPFA